MATYEVPLANVATKAALTGAREYLKAHQLKADPADLTERLRSWVEKMLPQALQDAKEAREAGMADVAEQTFLASMMLAGIGAAKEAGLPA